MGGPTFRCHRGPMRWHRPDSGYTLFELLWVAILLAILAGIAYPPVRSTVDQVQARGAREAVVAFVARARSEARAHGGARLVVRESEAALSVVRDGEEVSRLDLGGRYGVEVAAGGSGDPVQLRFDERGLGRVASRTIELSRGGARSAAVLSTFGRVARR